MVNFNNVAIVTLPPGSGSGVKAQPVNPRWTSSTMQLEELKEFKMLGKWEMEIEKVGFNGEYFEVETKVSNADIGYSTILRYNGSTLQEYKYHLAKSVRTLDDFAQLSAMRGSKQAVDFAPVEERERRSLLFGGEPLEPTSRKASKRGRSKKNTRRKKTK